MMRPLAALLRLIAGLFDLFPLKRRVVFLSRQSRVPSADFRLLKQQLIKDEPSLDVRVFCTDSELGSKLPFAWNILVQLWFARRSRVVVLDGYNPAVCIPKKREGVFVIQLWHAAGAIKKFGYQCLDTPAGRSSSQAELACMHKNYDLIAAAGPGAIGAYIETFGYPRENVAATGLPHLDLLLEKMGNDAIPESLANRYPWLLNGRVNVLYAPTLRRDRDSEWLSISVEQLAQALDPNGCNLIVSKHPLTRIDEQMFEHHSHVHVLSGQSTSALMPVADVMVTDYSALALEAGFVGVPVLFYVPDIAEYRVSPGLNIDPIEHPLLFGTDRPEEIAQVLSDKSVLAREASNYQHFAANYFAGIEPGAAQRLAGIIFDKLS